MKNNININNNNRSRYRPHSLPKINSEWMMDLHLTHKTIRLLEGDMGETLDGLGFGSDLDIRPKAQPIKETIDKQNCIKIKNF